MQFSARWIVRVSLSLIVTVLGVSAADSVIRLNSVGFLPGLPKKATIAGQCTQFEIKKVLDNSVAFSGVPQSVHNDDTGEDLYIADFSGLTENGDYYVEVQSLGKSANFRIADDVYADPYATMMLGMYLWRCGTSVSASYKGVTFSHGSCHLTDAYTTYYNGKDFWRDGAGGWHDAGDYNKYIVNSSTTVGIMLKAYEQFGSALNKVNLFISGSGSIPKYLTEVKWNIDWMLKMQFPDGKISHKISTLGFGGNVMPDAESDRRYYVPWSSSGTAGFTAVMAQASRIYKPYNPTFAIKCLQAATLSYEVLKSNSENVPADQSKFSTGTYETLDDDDRLWAAAEMWETTGDAKYLADFESRAAEYSVRKDMTWSDVSNLALITYLLSSRTGKNSTIVSGIQDDLISVADLLVKNSNQHGYGRTLGSSYYWGSNGTVAGNVYALYAAFKTTNDVKYYSAGQDALGYLLGRNVFGRSFVTGVGYNPPQNPHCRRSIASGKTWPGYLIGGPNGSADSWVDISSNYTTNEIAINWNGAMIYALAAYLPGSVTSTHFIPNVSKQTRFVQPFRIIQTDGSMHLPSGVKVFGLNGKLLNASSFQQSKLNRNGFYIIVPEKIEK